MGKNTSKLFRIFRPYMHLPSAKIKVLKSSQLEISSYTICGTYLYLSLTDVRVPCALCFINWVKIKEPFLVNVHHW